MGIYVVVFLSLSIYLPYVLETDIEFDIEIDIDIEHISFRGCRAIGETSRHHHETPDEKHLWYRKL
jgi:hypothetical protein